MHDLPSYIPPGGMFGENGQFLYDPDGPVGRLVDPTYGGYVTLGQLAQMRDSPAFNTGWVLDYSTGVATPTWGLPGQFPFGLSLADMYAMQAGADASSTSNGPTNAELLLLLLQ